MNASELLRSLQEEGVQLWHEGEELRYRAPKGLLSAGLIKALVSRKPEIIQLLQHRPEAGPCFQAWSPPPSNSQEVYRLSFAQQRMWFLKQLEPDSCSLNIAMGFSLNGPLDVPALERSLGELIDRHEAFRTTCAVNDSQPFQIIVPAGGARMPLEIVDLQTISEPEREPDLQRLITLEARRPFALDRSPLLRAKLFRSGEDRHVLLLTTHHFVVDGWSVGVMLRDLSALYDANSNDRQPSLQPLTSRYCDYAIWQRERLKGKVLEELLSYWKGKLGAAAELNLPTDRPVSRSPSGQGATHRFNLPPDLSGALKVLSRREGVTLFTTLLAAFKALLSRYTGQNDIVVGTAVSDRCMIETQTLVGCFANTLVLQTLCDGDPTFRQLLHRVHDTAIEAFDHQDMPFDVLVEQLGPERLHLRNPLFRVSFLLHQHADDQSLKLNGLEIQPLPIELGTSRFDLLLEFQNQGDQLSGLVEYSTDLFDPATIERMVRHFEIMLEGMLREPERPVGRLAMLTEREVRQVVRDWNQTASPSPARRCVHEEFERHARLQPDAPAVVTEDGSLSYGELHHRSGMLADYLRSEGVGSGSRVALCMDRSIEMIVGMLGILKTGGVYVPLDPAYPAERLALLLNEVDASVILTNAEAATSLPATSAKVICLNKDWPLIGDHGAWTPRANEVAAPATSRDPAYVIFTSGSTGTPKGVVVPHRAITRLVLNTNYLELGPQDRIAHLSNVCFDAATFEIWGALLTGACIVLIPKAVTLDPRRFAAELERRKVSTVFVTTALFNELAAVNSRIFQGVKQVLFGGEAVNPESVRHVLESGGPPRRLLHVYGPTECTTFATFYPVSHVEKDATTIPIGRPISNTTAYVLDKHGNPLPVGVPGELYLGGPGVAEGYLNQPELTREHFVPDPFGADKTQQIYRTGDIVKYLSDGNIEFIGRADEQVKIRGFRIEPGEVEALAKRHLDVEDTVVVAREDIPGDRRLIAYLVPRPGAAGSDWRGALQHKLPAYMVPSAFVELQALPLTPNGKVDRRALPAPERHTDSYRAPRTPQEGILCEIFADMLSIERVGIDDNFFELGGHSLLAMQIVSRIRKTFGIDLPISILFDHPIVWELAHQIEVSTRGAAGTSFPLTRTSRERPLPLSYFQERFWVCCHDLDDKPGHGMRITLMIRIRGQLYVPTLERSINDIVCRHEALRTTFPIVGGSPIQFVNPCVQQSLPTIELTERSDAYSHAEQLFKEMVFRRFDLINGPLFRTLLLRLREAEYRLFLSLHHINYDPVSLDILFRELGALYTAHLHGKPCPLPEVRIQYADFSVWQKEQVRKGTELYESQLAFWKKQFANCPAAPIELPFQRPAPVEPDPKSGHLVKRIPRVLCAELDAFSKRNGASLFMVLLAALKGHLCIQSGSDNIAIQLFTSSRKQAETDSMIGLFVNAIIVQTDLSGDPDFAEVLRRVRLSLLEAHERRDVPFQEVAAQTTPPSTNVVFSLDNEILMPNLAGLRLRGLPRHFPYVPFGFTYSIVNRSARLRSIVYFNSRLYDPEGVKLFVAQYHWLLGKIVSNPKQKLSALIPKPI